MNWYIYVSTAAAWVLFAIWKKSDFMNLALKLTMLSLAVWGTYWTVRV